MTTKRTKPRCKGCGVCCVSLHGDIAYCDVEPGDTKRLTSAERKHVCYPSFFDQACQALDGRKAVYGAIETRWRTQRAGPLKGLEACTCFFLKGSVLKDAVCKIYPRRPDTCKKACSPGERACLEARRMVMEMAERERDK